MTPRATSANPTLDVVIAMDPIWMLIGPGEGVPRKIIKTPTMMMKSTTKLRTQDLSG